MSEGAPLYCPDHNDKNKTLMKKQNKEKWAWGIDFDRSFEDMQGYAGWREYLKSFIKKVEAKAYKRGVEKGREDRGKSCRDLT